MGLILLAQARIKYRFLTTIKHLSLGDKNMRSSNGNYMSV